MGKRKPKVVDDTLDVHGLTEAQLLVTLQLHWPKWRSLHTVRIIHGQGSVLKPAVERWCDDIGLPYLPDTRNPGALRIFPHQRTLPNTALSTSLRDSGLMMPPSREITKPSAAAPSQAVSEAAKRRDDALWQAEISRLDSQGRGRGKPVDDGKPRAPIVIAPLQLRYDEGYWKAELSRVAETDGETLQKQKRTGLDKLAPPMQPAKPIDRKQRQQGAHAPPQRDVDAERALFEEEMDRLGDFDSFEIKRAKSD